VQALVVISSLMYDPHSLVPRSAAEGVR